MMLDITLKGRRLRRRYGYLAATPAVCPTVRQRGYFVASYSNQMGRPVGSASGVMLSVDAEAPLLPTAFVADAEQV